MSAMCRDQVRRGAPRGFALPTAIFMMVILAALGVFITRINVMQTGSTALDALGVQAYQAALAGTEWGAYQALRVNGPFPAPCFTQTDLTFAGTALAPFTTTVTCTRSSTNELGVIVTVDKITATACNQPPCLTATPANASFVSRQLSITLGQP